MAASINDFREDGFLVVRDAVAPDIVRACVDAIETELRARAVDPRDPATWTLPVIRFNCPEGPAFAAAGMSAALREVYDTLLGPGRWVPRDGVGGTVPVRFPSTKDPGDAGWHIDGSYDVGGQWWVNVRSRGRGLLALFLFTDVGDADAPTEVLVGSHLDVPRVLAPFGDRGVFFGDVAGRLHTSTFRRPRARATGRAGDVYVCHPFLVHRATWPHFGARPRMVAQPSIALHQPFALRDGTDGCAVERSILRGLE
jgi:phytanoyl-CoA dioxygenase PhyH